MDHLALRGVKMASQRDWRVDWRFIFLRLLNKPKDSAIEFPPAED